MPGARIPAGRYALGTFTEQEHGLRGAAGPGGGAAARRLSRRQIRDRLQSTTTTSSTDSWRAPRPEMDEANKTTLKKHNSGTVRKNVGDSYRRRLVIKVLRSADLYRRIEGCWYGIVLGATRPSGEMSV
ncbi:hypothetical protein GCM10010279_35530 [Streptomyces mutabilis]|nr:hypothetical protein GCM10010279_35530 [Streptomyces mutabilis]